jgi:hypothetical protein
MFCSNCGKSATGKFCSNCGRPLVGAAPTEAEPVLEFDWHESFDYEAILRMPEVQTRLNRAANRATEGVTSESVLEGCESLFGAMTGGVPLKLVAAISQPLATKLGFKIHKSHAVPLMKAPGEVIVELLFCFAQHGIKVTEATHQPGRCELRGAVPRSVWAFNSNLSATIERAPTGVLLTIGIEVPGQKYDWGASQRLLDQLFGELTKPGKAA